MAAEKDISMNETAIEAVDLAIGYRQRSGEKVIAGGISLKLYTGEVTCLLGLNGAGKSTLLRTLCGFQPALRGEVLLLGKPLSSFSQGEFALNVGVVLTEKTNAGGISVYELVSLGRHPYTGFFGHLKPTDHAIIRSSLEAAGIADKASNYVSELSDGERQKAMIAKVLAQQCPIIILDEPTAFLDVTSRIETMVLLRKLAKEQGKAILLSTHDMDSAIQMADRIWLQKRQLDMVVKPTDSNQQTTAARPQPHPSSATVSQQSSTASPIISGSPEDLILSGQFGRYFDKPGITFDPSTGKLNTADVGKPIGIEGDFQTAYWVGNAVIRNGFRPSAVSPEHPRIICHAPTDIEVIFPDGDSLHSDTIAGLITYLL